MKENTRMLRQILTCSSAVAALTLGLSAQTPAPACTTGNQHRHYTFAPAGQQMPYRVFVPPTGDGKASLPIILMLHGAGADENTYMNMNEGLLPKLAAQHGWLNTGRFLSSAPGIKPGGVGITIYESNR